MYHLEFEYIDANGELYGTGVDKEKLTTFDDIFNRIKVFEEYWKKNGFKLRFKAGTYFRYHNDKTGEDWKIKVVCN